MSLRTATVAALILLLTGCAANVTRGSSDAAMARMPSSAATRLVLNVTGSDASSKASDWADFKREWTENFAEEATKAGIPLVVQDGPARVTGDAGTLLSVYVTDYRFIRPGTRYAVGVMSGNAYIESTLTFRDLKTGEVFRTQAANTTSSAWQGVFAPMTNKQVEAIAADVFRQIKAGQIGRN